MIFEKIREIVVEQLGVNEEDVKLETRFIEDLEADSLDLFQVIMEIEDAFDSLINRAAQFITTKN